MWGRLGDVPVPGNYLGDPSADYALWRPSTGTWLLKDAGTGGTWSVSQGASGDVPLSYRGSCGELYLATFRPSTGNWTIKLTNGYVVTAAHSFGGSDTVPFVVNVPSDTICLN